LKKGFFYIVFCLNVSLLFAQSERFNIIKTQQLFKNDSISFLYNKHTTSAPFFYRNPKDTGKTKLNLSLSPLLALEPSYSLNTEKSFFFNWNIGVQAKLETNKGWSGEVNYVRNFFDYSGFYAQHIEQTNDVYGYGYSDTTSGATTYISGFIAYQPNKTFTFEAGMGNHFIGEGYRSLLLADNAYPYPYFKISTQFWKIKYDNIYSNWWDIRFSNGDAANFLDKYSTTHYLSYNPLKWLNVGFFETIVFSGYDGDYYRGFDLNYINPVIFYRPVEYSQGSADNALMGLTLKAILKQKHVFYAQFLIDEFLLAEVRKGQGWWANKYAVQFGVKSRDLFGIKHLNSLFEMNIVRPFTYSYFERNPGTSALLNYAHYGMPMAHPAGANVMEQIARFSYRKEKWLFELNFNYLTTGLDTGNVNLGQNIFKSYDSRTKDYGNSFLQGERTTTLHSKLKVNYLLVKGAGWYAFALVHNYRLQNSMSAFNQTFFSLGVKTFVRNRYDDY
tara:strand:- start:66910 stop:68415 length:1506 start_codon:yes stop_codon:yes gene_type:complete